MNRFQVLNIQRTAIAQLRALLLLTTKIPLLISMDHSDSNWNSAVLLKIGFTLTSWLTDKTPLS